MPFARIAITLPKDLLAAADRRANEEHHSRSRVIADALRAYLTTPSAVREPARPAYATDAFGAARRQQLERDLARSPSERLRQAEAAARLAQTRRSPRGSREQVIAFDSSEDFWEWKRANRG